MTKRKLKDKILYSKLSTPQKQPIFSRIREGLTKVSFYFPKFYNFFTKRVTGGLLDNYGITPKEENKI